jgi:hypothetical protein
MPLCAPHSISKHNGTTTLFPALNILDGAVVGRCMPSHTHKEFIKFLNAVERAVRPGRIIHAIADNDATHKHPKSLPRRKPGSSSGSPIIRAGCSISPRPPHPGSTPSKVSSRPSPAGASDAGVFKSLADLEEAIRRYIRQHNQSSKPFVWTKPADTILAKLTRLPVPSE